MAADRTYDVFLLEKGTKLTIISQFYNLLQHQPTLTLTRHDTLLYLSKTVHQIRDENCQEILASEMMHCIIDKVQEEDLSKGNFCLPFQYINVFPKWRLAFPQCIDDPERTRLSTYVSMYRIHHCQVNEQYCL